MSLTPPLLRVAAEAGYHTSWAIWSVSTGSSLIPMVAFERPNGKREMIRFVADTPKLAIEQGQR